eukprot:Filipodium_phascolosomae@DN264_c0_g1_i1.p1
MDTGVTVAEECMSTFHQIKMQHALRYVIYKIAEQKEIQVDACGDKGAGYEDFLEALPSGEPRYAVVDFDYETADGRPQEKLIFVAWSPDDSKVQLKMLYASSKDAIKKRLSGFAKELQATDKGDLNRTDVIEIMRR